MSDQTKMYISCPEKYEESIIKKIQEQLQLFGVRLETSLSGYLTPFDDGVQCGWVFFIVTEATLNSALQLKHLEFIDRTQPFGAIRVFAVIDGPASLEFEIRSRCRQPIFVYHKKDYEQNASENIWKASIRRVIYHVIDGALDSCKYRSLKDFITMNCLTLPDEVKQNLKEYLKRNSSTYEDRLENFKILYKTMPLLLNTGYLRGNRLNKICMSPLKNILHPEYSSEYEANVLIKREPLDESEYFAVEEGFCVLLNAFSTQVETTHFCVKPTEGQTSLFTAQ